MRLTEIQLDLSTRHSPTKCRLILCTLNLAGTFYRYIGYGLISLFYIQLLWFRCLSPVSNSLVFGASLKSIPHPSLTIRFLAPATLLQFGRRGLRLWLWLWLLLSSQIFMVSWLTWLRVSWYLNLAIPGYSSKKQGAMVGRYEEHLGNICIQDV